MMSPFDLPGPQFLLFFVIACSALIVILRFVQRRFDGAGVPRFDDLDPYALACLRGGPDEALRVTVISLVDRGMLRVDTNRNLWTAPGAIEYARRPIEQALLWQFANGALSSTTFDERPKDAARAIEAHLRTLGLLPSGKHWAVRITLTLTALTWIAWLATTKIEVALARGHHNILFLQILAFLFAVGSIVVLVPGRKTYLGVTTQRDFQTLFSGLRDGSTQIQPGGRTQDLAYLAGVFGLASLPAFALPVATMLFPMQTPQAWGWGGLSSGSSSGSSCSSSSSSCSSSSSSCSSSSCSSGSSCGSSCGGGGGCGGCGSS